MIYEMKHLSEHFVKEAVKGWLKEGFVYLSKNLPDDSLTNGAE